MLRTIPIRTNLLAYFMSIVALVAVVEISLQYYFSLQLADKAADKTFEQVSEKLSIFIRERNRELSSIIDLVSHDRSLANLPAVGELHEATDTFLNVLDGNDSIYAMYLGKDNGDFFEFIHMGRFPDLIEKFQADASTKWTVIQIRGDGRERTKYWHFYDDSMQLLGSRQELHSYDPRVRPWFTKAEKSDKVISTDPYLFQFLNAAGITYAKTLETGDGVLAIDITMSALNEFLAGQRFGESSEVFLYDRYGEKYASSNPLALGTGEIDELEVDVVPVELSDEERAFIEAHPTLRVSNELDWPPIDFATRGVPMGYAIDLLDILARKTGMELQFINGYTWDELIELFKDGKLDVLHPAFKSESRKEWGLFSEPIHEIRSLLVHHKDQPVSGIEDFKGKTIAIPEGWLTSEFLATHYPEITVLKVPQAIDAYFAVNDGRADATVDHRLSMTYMRDKYGLNNVVAGPWFSDFDDNESQKLHLILQKDDELLRDIFNKALAGLTENELAAVRERWEDPFCEIGEDCKNAIIDRSTVVNKAFLQVPAGEASDLIRYEDEGGEYFAHSAPLDTFSESGHRLGLTELSDHFLAPFMEKVQVSLNTAIVVFLLIIPIVLYATRQILKPLEALMEENRKVGKRQYSEVKPIKTYIAELRDLSDSLIDMSASIEAYEEAQEALMDSFIQLIADAIDAKSHYTAGHCSRVPEIGIMLAEVAHESNDGPFADFHFHSEDEWREFKVGAWLHDCGKVTTPEYVVDKATKLETIYNRIHEVRMRFEVLWRDAEIAALTRRLEGEDAATVQAWLDQERQQLHDDFAFIAECNEGGEFMSEERQERVRQIAQRRWERYFDNRLGISQDEEQRYGDQPAEQLPVEEQLLSDRPEHIVPRVHFDHEAYVAQGFKQEVPQDLYNYGEVYNLCIAKGTLTEEERFKINEHVIMTIKMLEQLPLPDNMQRVPEYAGTHHEKLDGEGYPRKLSADELSTAARIMALADIFEALTASDRPYKKAKPLSEAIKIMGFMAKDQHIDAEVFSLFLRSGVYLKYAHKYLDPEQIDEVDVEQYVA